MTLTIKRRKLDDFTTAYIEAALWSTTDESDDRTGGDPLDYNYGFEDIAEETLDKMIADCAAFQRDNARALSTRDAKYGGHDFWLTRNGHGAGFWDGDWSAVAGKRLTAASKRCGEVYLYVGDDGQIYS